MPFQKGHKYAKGGRRPGAGAKPKGYQQAKLMATEMAKAYIEASVKPVMHQYFQLAAGRLVNKYHEGKIIGQEFECDPPTTRHFVDKLIPDEKEDKQDKRPLQLNVVLKMGDAASNSEQIEAKPDAPKLITYELGELEDDPTEKPK